MAHATPPSADVLAETEKLLRFAAENKSGLPFVVISSIENAFDAHRKGSWTAETSASFLSACDQLRTHLMTGVLSI